MLTSWPEISLVQIVYFDITRAPSGLLVAKSPDLPGRAPSALNAQALGDAIEDSIHRYFFEAGESVRVSRARGRGGNDLSTWEVETTDGDAQPYLMAAE
jgi:hypothetical protein